MRDAWPSVAGRICDKPFDHLARQPRNALEDEIRRDRPRLLAALTIDRDLLPPEVALVS